MSQIPAVSELTGLARIPILLLDYAAKHGADRQGLLREAGLTEADLANPDTRVGQTKIEGLWRGVAQRLASPGLGLKIGASLRVRDWGLVGYTMAYSGTVANAISRLERYTHIMNEAIRVRLMLEEGRGSLVTESSMSVDRLEYPVDSRLAAFLAVIREITKRQVQPLEVTFSYPRPADTSEHARFFGCPLLFGRPETALVLRAEDLKLPVSSADEDLCSYLDRLAEETLESLGDEGSFVQRVQRAIWSELSGGRPSLQQTARMLGVSVRTLQRRLREEKTSFAHVLESFRREMAGGLLRQHSLAIYEVAFLLGYSEPSTFYRAFRRWHGASPHEFRASLA